MHSKLQIIGPRIFENYIFLRQITATKSDEKRMKALKNANRDQLLALVEVCSNILASNFNLTKKQREKILPHASYVRKLARARSELSARKIIQKGNGIFLPSILVPILFEVARHFIE